MGEQLMKQLWAVATVATLVAATAMVPAGTGTAATNAHLPSLNPAALEQAIAGLPDNRATAALVQISGSSGHWNGTSGRANMAPASPAQSNDEFRIGSISKIFLAIVVLQLVHEHRITLDRPIQDYLPSLLPANDPPITIAELLNHTSGLGPADGVVRTDDMQWFLAHHLDDYTAEQLLGDVLHRPLIFTPGTQQQYNGVNYLVLAMLIHHVTGQNYAREIQQRIVLPLGLSHTFVPISDPRFLGPHLHGYYPAAAGTALVDITQQNPSLYGAQGGMISTTADLGTFLAALFSGSLLPRRTGGHVHHSPLGHRTDPLRHGPAELHPAQRDRAVGPHR
jgi:D-alanyl-D-alanine carboxypeptidase